MDNDHPSPHTTSQPGSYRGAQQHRLRAILKQVGLGIGALAAAAGILTVSHWSILSRLTIEPVELCEPHQITGHDLKSGRIISHLSVCLESVVFDEIYRTRLVRNVLVQLQRLSERPDQATLLWAAEHGHIDNVRLLIEQGADVDMQDNRGGVSPLYWAAEQGHSEIVTILIENGANVDHGGAYDARPLHAAARHGHIDIVQLLIAQGAEVDPQNTSSITPLGYAVMNEHIRVVEMLLEQGVDASDQDRYGYTPLNNAVADENSEIAQLLLDYGADVNLQTPLVGAARRGNYELVKLLIDYGADVNRPNRIDQTPLSVAVKHEHSNIIQLLIDHGAQSKVMGDLSEHRSSQARSGELSVRP